jgi:hypothetical protein
MSIWSGVTNISKRSKDITGLLPLAQISRRVNLIMIHVHFCRNGDIRGQSLGSQRLRLIVFMDVNMTIYYKVRCLPKLVRRS